MEMNEADTRAKLIDPAIHRRGWTEDLIRREETAGTIGVNGGETLRWNLSFGGGCEELAAGATTNLSWTSTASDDGAAGGIALKPSAGGGAAFDSDRGFLLHPNPAIRELVAREIAAGVRA